MAVRGENTGIPDIPPYEEMEDREGLMGRLLALLGGIGQSELGAIWADPTMEEILRANTIRMNPEAPFDIEQATNVNVNALSQMIAALENATTEAQDIADTLFEDPSALSEMEDPGALVTGILESSALGFLGPPGASPVSTTPQGIVLPGGAGVTVDIGNIGSISDINFETIFEKLKGYIPGISLPSWLPSAGVIFIPELQDKIRQVDEAIGGVIDSVGGALEGEEDAQGVLDAIGGVIGEVFDAVVYNEDATTEEQEGILQNAVGSIFDVISSVLEGTADSSTIGTIVSGVATSVLGTSLPNWLPGVLTTVFTPGSPVISTVQRVLSEMGITLPFTEEEVEQDPALMFTNRGNNYFVNSETDEYFQLAESEDIDFELNGEYTREQLENTGLETINSGTYQSLLDDLSFHALEEDIYQYSIKALAQRFEEEGGIVPGDFNLMDEQSQYDFFIGEFFEPTPVKQAPIEQPEPEPAPEPQPQPEPQPEPQPDPDPDPDPEPDPDVTSVVEGLFADFLEQLDTEFTGQQDQINQIIQNFVETLPDYNAMPTMEDIAEYFETNGVTLSQENFDRIQQELANAGYLTQDQLTEALSGVATTEQVNEAIQGAGFATPEQVLQYLAEAGYATPEDITTALTNSGFVTDERLTLALAEAGYATPEQVEDIVNNAISNIVIPEGATAEEVQQLIQDAIDGIPAGISLDDVSGVVNEAIANIDFPEGLSESDVTNIVDSFGFATTTDVQAGFDDLNDRFDDALNGIATQFSDQEAEFLAGITGLEASLIQSLAAVEGGLSTELETLGTDLISLQEDVAGRFDEFEASFTGFQTDVETQFGDLNDRLNDSTLR